VIDEAELEQRLLGYRATPAAGWRGELRRSLLASRPPPARPTHLWVRVGTSAGMGTAVLAVAAVLS
jgi:hypothetical protein